MSCLITLLHSWINIVTIVFSRNLDLCLRFLDSKSSQFPTHLNLLLVCQVAKSSRLRCSTSPPGRLVQEKKKRNFVFSFLDYIMLTLCLIIINMQQASQKTWTLSVTKVERSVKGQLFKSQCLSFSIVKWVLKPVKDCSETMM